MKKGFLKNKKPGVYFNVIACVFALVTVIAYAAAGQDSYGFVPMVDVLLVLGIAAGLLFSWKDMAGLGPVITMACFGAGFGLFLNSRFMYYAHQYYGIASDPISGAMIVTSVGFIGTILLEIIAGFMQWGNKK